VLRINIGFFSMLRGINSCSGSIGLSMVSLSMGYAFICVTWRVFILLFFGSKSNARYTGRLGDPGIVEEKQSGSSILVNV